MSILGTEFQEEAQSLEAVGNPNVQSIHVEKFETDHHFTSSSPDAGVNIHNKSQHIIPKRSMGPYKTSDTIY